MNWIDLLVLVVLGFGIIKGLYDGFIKQVIALASLVLAVFFAGQIARPFRDMLMSNVSIANSISPQVITIGCYILSFMLIIMVLRKLSILLNKTVNMIAPTSCLNFVLGGLLGAVSMLFFLSLTFNIITNVDPNSKIIKEDTKNRSIFFYKVEKVVTFIAPLIKQSHFIKEETPDLQKDKDNQDKKLETSKVTV